MRKIIPFGWSIFSNEFTLLYPGKQPIVDSHALRLLLVFLKHLAAYTAPPTESHTFDFPLDTLEQRALHCPKLDAAYVQRAIDDLPNRKRIELEVLHDFCFGGFVVFFEVSGITPQTVTLQLIEVRHHCPEDEKDLPKIGQAISELIQALEQPR